jgi:hypothetical protein
MGLENLVSETFARLESTQLGAARPERVAEQDYRSFCDALGASERGRAFLHEYARRNRHADTEVVLAALSRLEQTARAHQAEPEAERIRQDLRALLETLRGAKPQIDSSPGAIKAATLAALLEFVQARLETLISPRTTLEQVPVPEQPELPIPQPTPVPPVLSLVQTRLNKIIPEVSFFDSAAAPAEPPPAARTAMPVAEPVAPATEVAPLTDAGVADDPKPAIEPYELWLDPGLADLLTPERKPAAQTQPIDEKSSQPTTALAALAATFTKSEQITSAPVGALATVTPPPVILQTTQTAAAAIKPAPTAKSSPLKTDDPLALIMALSESERMALFT